MGQGVAYMAELKGVPCSVVVPDQAPEAKLGPIRRMGGKVLKVCFDDWWEIIQSGKCVQVAAWAFVAP
jgi:threonine dehydratase